MIRCCKCVLPAGYELASKDVRNVHRHRQVCTLHMLEAIHEDTTGSWEEVRVIRL